MLILAVMYDLSLLSFLSSLSLLNILSLFCLMKDKYLDYKKRWMMMDYKDSFDFAENVPPVLFI